MPRRYNNYLLAVTVAFAMGAIGCMLLEVTSILVITYDGWKHEVSIHAGARRGDGSILQISWLYFAAPLTVLAYFSYRRWRSTPTSLTLRGFDVVRSEDAEDDTDREGGATT